ncbi:putative reverse transcriptase domain-containing protein [Tanacetum coccineum]|uniref:Reverse transcriptase domain-containing protein n=1 Tax=Tanacetum coccineum TaxID=301880 RepID=A0ABQ5JBN8_9ASTR
MTQMRAIAPSTYHLLLLSGTLPLLSIPLPARSIAHRDDIPEANIPLRKRARFIAPTRRCEIGETSAPGAARQPGSIVAHRVDYIFLDTIDASIRASEGKTMAAIEYAQEDHAVVRAEIGLLRSKRLAYEQELSETSQALTRSEAHNRSLEARISSMETQLYRMKWQRQDADDRAIRHIMRTHALEAGARVDTLEDTVGCRGFVYLSSYLVWHAKYYGSLPASITLGLYFHFVPHLYWSPVTKWFEKMEYAFHISNCTVACQIKFATCTLQGITLTWWNSHIKTVTHEVAYAMTWKTLKKMMTDKYCPRGEIKKLEIEMWNLKVKGIDVVGYNQRFQELSLMCSRMFPKESDEIEKYVGGLPDMIHGSVMASKLKTMQDAIEFSTKLMDKKINTFAERQSDNKRKFENTSRNNQNQNQGNQAGNDNAVARAYGVGTARTTPNSNVFTGTFILNNHYASFLFDTGVDKSFVSSTFSSLIDIVPTALDYGVDVELADGRIIWVNTLIRGCTLNFLNHPFNIDLMPVEMGSFDVIIDMD